MASQGARHFPRKAVRLRARITSVRQHELEAFTVNISASGSLIECRDARLALNDSVVLSIHRLGAIRGRVAWLDRGLIGIEFTVSPDSVIARFATVGIALDASAVDQN